MHLVVSKQLGRQKCREKSKTMRQEDLKGKKKPSAKKFLFVYICNNRSCKYLIFLLDFFYEPALIH